MSDTHAGHTKLNGRKRWITAVGLSVFMGWMAGTAPALAVPAPMEMESDQEGQRSFSFGVLTADPTRDVEIDNRRFALHPDAMVRDNEGRVRSLQDLCQGAVVKFHVRQRKIDLLIWTLPE